MSEDNIEGIPGISVIGKNKSFALGPEMSLAIVRNGVLYGLLKLNFEWETYARTTTQGREFNLVLTVLSETDHASDALSSPGVQK